MLTPPGEATAGLPMLQPILVGEDLAHFHGRFKAPSPAVFVLLGRVEPKSEEEGVTLYGTPRALRQLAVQLLKAADQEASRAS